MATIIAQRHSDPKFYEEGVGNKVFRVQNILYKLDGRALARISGFLTSLLASVAQETSDAAPIDIIGEVQTPEWEIFVSLAYSSPAQQWPQDNDEANSLLLRLLELSRYFISPSTRALALATIKHRNWRFPAAQLIHLCYAYGTTSLFSMAFQRLVAMPLRSLTQADLEWLGFTVYVALARVKEAIQEHQCIIAAEEPQFTRDRPHSADCQDNAACAEDWHAAWWNGIGRFLLDGRNPLTWMDTVQQFFQMKDFGRTHESCKILMFAVVHGGQAHNHIYEMMDITIRRLTAHIQELD